MRIRAIIVAGILLGGCATVEDIRASEPFDEVSVADGYREVTNCLVDYLQQYFQVVPITRERERRATATVWLDNGWSRLPLWEAEMSADGEQHTVVRVRTSLSLHGSGRGRARAVRDALRSCGYSA